MVFLNFYDHIVLPVTLNLPVEQLEDNVHVNECFDSVEKGICPALTFLNISFVLYV